MVVPSFSSHSPVVFFIPGFTLGLIYITALYSLINLLTAPTGPYQRTILEDAWGKTKESSWDNRKVESGSFSTQRGDQIWLIKM